jgi:hypothetical protein
MVDRGHVQNGMVILDPAAELSDGTEGSSSRSKTVNARRWLSAFRM